MFRRLGDWLEIRLGLRSFYNKQVAYVLPESISFWSFFGGITIGCILIQILTGIYMVTYYIPTPDLAHQSISDMCNNTEYGALIRNIHRWCATFGMAFLTIHALHVMARRAYRPPRELNWWVGLILAFLYLLMLITGIIVVWDWRSYWELVVWIDWVNVIPGIGPYLKEPLLQGFTLGRNYVAHIWILPLTLFGFFFIHIVLFRRLGMSDRV